MSNLSGKKQPPPQLRAVPPVSVEAQDTGNRVARVLGGAVSFGYYGAISLALGYAILPLQRLAARAFGWRGDPQLAAQREIHRLTRSWLWLSEAVGGCRVRFHHAERLRRDSLLIVANHPSLADSPMLTSQLPEADFVVSSSWTRNPILGRTIRAAGYLREDSGTALIREAVSRLRAGRRVVMYPEGARTTAEGLGAFHRGVAHIALRAGCDIQPVVIHVRPRTLIKGESVLDMPPQIPQFDFEVGEPWRAEDLQRPGEGRSDAARRITAELRDHFQKRWERGCH